MSSREAGRGEGQNNQSAEEKQRLNEEGKRVLAEPGPLERLKRAQEKVPELAEMGKKRDILKKEWEVFDKQMKDIAFAQALIDLAERAATDLEKDTVFDENGAIAGRSRRFTPDIDVAIKREWEHRAENVARDLKQINKFVDALAAEPENRKLRDLKHQGIRTVENDTNSVEFRVYSGKVKDDGNPEEVAIDLDEIVSSLSGRINFSGMDGSTPEKQQLLHALREAFPDAPQGVFDSSEEVEQRLKKQEEEYKKGIEEQQKKAAEEEKRRKKVEAQIAKLKKSLE